MMKCTKIRTQNMICVLSNILQSSILDGRLMQFSLNNQNDGATGESLTALLALPCFCSLFNCLPVSWVRQLVEFILGEQFYLLFQLFLF